MHIISQLFEILTLRRKVAELEYNPSVALLAGAVLVALGAYVNSLSPGLSQPFALSLAQYSVQALLLYGLLAMQSKSGRFIQTISALYGVTVMIQLASLVTLSVPGLVVIGLTLAIWNFYISIVIVRDTLETSTLMGLLWIFALNAASVVVLMTLFPDFQSMIQAVVEQMETAPTSD